MTPTTFEPPARTHEQAIALLRRPFAPGAIGFRAMGKTQLGGDPYGGANVAAYLNAQSILQRLNCVAPGRWRQRFAPAPPELTAGAERRYLACQLLISLPHVEGGADTEAVYEDVGELDDGALAGLKALYSDARKRAAVAAGIGAYLYTTLEPVVLPIGPAVRQVQAIRRPGRRDLLVLSPETEQWLRDGYLARVTSEVVARDLGPILAHGEPETGRGQGEAGELPAPEPDTAEPARVQAPAGASGEGEQAAGAPAAGSPNGRGHLVRIDFGRLGPGGPAAA
ncbi:MAG: hypothetical protein QOE28_3020 [Solirubrobacteraceae bacterium]|jgi:hypothetical protein|nr:hypothetical protein [Solirubrobacteraceae bacterium]